MTDRPRPTASGIAKAPLAPARKPASSPGDSRPGPIPEDSVDGARFRAIEAQRTKPADLSDEELQEVASKKATCPFIGAAVATRALPVRNSADRPLASIDDVVALGSSGGGDLGDVLEIFAKGNHSKMLGPSGKLDAPVPPSLFSLDFPGSQGSHPGHSGILQGDPTQLNSGRFSQEDFDRLISRAHRGYLKRDDIAAYIAENVIKDPNSKVFTGSAKAVLGDLALFVASTGPAFLESFKNLAHGGSESKASRKAYEALTKTLGEDNLVGSAGEFGLLMALLANSPKTIEIDGEPAVSVDDLTRMFRDKQFPEGWETWRKTRLDWITNTTALLVEAGKVYIRLGGKPEAK